MSKSMIVPLIVLLAVLGAGTYVQGIVSERWGVDTTERLAELAENINQRLPLKFGEWDGVANEMDEQQFKASKCKAARSFSFKNLRTGEEVEVYIVAGTARNVTIHTPDQCYVGAGYEMEGEIQTYAVECRDVAKPVEFLTATFRRDAADGITRLRVFWTFSDNGQWLGPKYEKVTFAGKKHLAKIYLITHIPLGEDKVDENASLVFADDAMAMLNEMLFDKSGNVSTGVPTAAADSAEPAATANDTPATEAEAVPDTSGTDSHSDTSPTSR